MFSQAEINLMEKQLLFLLDYNLAITEEEVVRCSETFLSRYTFEEPEMELPPTPESTVGLPVTPRLPSGHIIAPAPAAPKPDGPSRLPSSTNIYDLAAPGLDRSDSTSSFGSDGPMTPRSAESTPSPDLAPTARIARAVAAAVSLQRPAPVVLAPGGGYEYQRSRDVHIADPSLSPMSTVASAGAAAKDTRDSIVRRLFGRRRDDGVVA